jgi:adenine deaminase
LIFLQIAGMKMKTPHQVTGLLVDILNRDIFPATVTIAEGVVSQIERLEPLAEEKPLPYLLPGFIDAHVHIESSMLIPTEFARMAVVHGTVATVSDPHEIANVCGIEGVEFMIENGKKVPFKFNFGAPSCVPATTFETAGDALDGEAVEKLLLRPDVKYLSEMMNFPGVLFKDDQVMQKIGVAHKLGKPVDGHAPGLRGDEVQKYIDAGITTDHECFTYDEALDKLQRGMKIIIREGSAAKNFEALIPLVDSWHDSMMFCSDDKHPDSLEEGHINQLCARAVSKGLDVFKVLQVACVNPVVHYNLNVGQLKVGDPADFILVNDLKNFEVLETYINGQLVAKGGKSLISSVADEKVNHMNRFECSLLQAGDFSIPFTGQAKVPVIEALDGQLITNRLNLEPKTEGNYIVPDLERDILKIAVINRYHHAPVAKGFIRNFGLKRGALASSVAHDSHNIVVVGCDDASMALAANSVVECRGGISVTDGLKLHILPLPVAGLMTGNDGYEIAAQYTLLDRFAKNELGTTLTSPFMTLSFMALLVIPHLKLSDKGLFDGDRFEFVT